jgi:hypothetical protein
VGVIYKNYLVVKFIVTPDARGNFLEGILLEEL